MHNRINRHRVVALSGLLVTSMAAAAPDDSQRRPTASAESSQPDQIVAPLSPIMQRQTTNPEGTGPGRALAKDDGPERRERADNRVAFGFSSFMYNVYGLGVSGSAGYYINPDFLVEASVAGAASFLPNFQAARHLTLGLRTFVSDSFYLKLGAGYRAYRVDDWIEDTIEALFEASFQTPKNADRYLEGSDWGLDLSIGHRWQWGFFAIDIDWLGAYVPLQTLKIEAVIEDEDIKRVVLREELDSGQGQDSVDWRLLNIHLLLSF